MNTIIMNLIQSSSTSSSTSGKVEGLRNDYFGKKEVEGGHDYYLKVFGRLSL